MAAAGEDVLMRLVALVGLALALAGCGGASKATLDDAAEATAGDTSRFEMTFVTRVPRRRARVS
jgi:hypothetical protein